VIWRIKLTLTRSNQQEVESHRVASFAHAAADDDTEHEVVKGAMFAFFYLTLQQWYIWHSLFLRLSPYQAYEAKMRKAAELSVGTRILHLTSVSVRFVGPWTRGRLEMETAGLYIGNNIHLRHLIVHFEGLWECIQSSCKGMVLNESIKALEVNIDIGNQILFEQ
jgi:hypothetical protein